MNPRSLTCFAAFFLSMALCSPLLAQNTEKKSADASVAYFAGGCFWCTEEIFEQTPGVKSVFSGYQNFCRKNPNNPYIQQTLTSKLKKLDLSYPKGHGSN
jgi:hypothetical protein